MSANSASLNSPTWWSILFACAPLLVAARPAHAQTCAANADCPDRFTCETVGTTPCDSPKTCPAGDKCPVPADCVPMDIKECKSPACSKDADCPTGMVCYAQTSTECSGSTPVVCKPGATCPQPVDAGEPTCKDTTTHSCVPRYVPPCTADKDCGEGFKCVAGQECMCSGGGGVPTDGGKPVTMPDQCTCKPTATSSCELQDVVCSKASDCPSGFTCENNPTRTACVKAPGSASHGTAGEAASDAGSAPDASSGCSTDTTVPAKLCLPPYYDVLGRSAVGIGTDKSEASGTADGGAPGAAGTGGGTTHTATKTKPKHGCAVSATSETGAALPSLAVLGLVAMLLRRRARSA
jgi:MYXO-CTERM domain-containing protein